MEKCSVSAFIPVYKLLATKFILQIFYILYIHNASISGSHSYPLNSQGSGPVCLLHSSKTSVLQPTAAVSGPRTRRSLKDKSKWRRLKETGD